MPIDQALISRMIRAAKLDASLYEEVEHDLNATTPAATVVGIVAVAQAIGALISFLTFAPIAAMFGLPTESFVQMLGTTIIDFVLAFIGWIIWSCLTWWIGSKVFGGTATPGELLRTVGFAMSPGVLTIAVIVPCLGHLVALAGAIWMLVAGVVAVRQALDIDTGKAILTVIISAVPYVLLWWLLNKLITL